MKTLLDEIQIKQLEGPHFRLCDSDGAFADLIFIEPVTQPEDWESLAEDIEYSLNGGKRKEP